MLKKVYVNKISCHGNSKGSNIIVGQTHFIKTVEDLYEIMVASSHYIKFGIAFCEASQLCLIRLAGNDRHLQQIANINA